MIFIDFLLIFPNMHSMPILLAGKIFELYIAYISRTLDYLTMCEPRADCENPGDKMTFDELRGGQGLAETEPVTTLVKSLNFYSTNAVMVELQCGIIIGRHNYWQGGRLCTPKQYFFMAAGTHRNPAARI